MTPNPSQLYELKLQPQDFRVTEDLDIEMLGDGEHLWLLIEKQNLTTDIARHIISKVFNVKVDQVSAAGKKDRHAITQQWVSVRLPGTAPSQVSTAAEAIAEYLLASPLYEGEVLQVLQASVHNKKCQVGCHRGNYFEIRAVFSSDFRSFLCAQDLDLPQQLLLVQQELQVQGFANFFGDQRFGGVQALADIDAKLSQIHKKTRPGRLKPKDAWTFSQARAWLFNDCLRQRQSINDLRLPVIGDLLNLTGSGSCFVVDSLDEVLLKRVLNGDVVVTGPLFGRANPTLMPEGVVAALENNVFSKLSELGQKQLLKFQEAARRPLLIYPKSLQVNLHPDALQLSFWLPKGAYATECVRAFFETWLACDLFSLDGAQASWRA